MWFKLAIKQERGIPRFEKYEIITDLGVLHKKSLWCLPPDFLGFDDGTRKLPTNSSILGSAYDPRFGVNYDNAQGVTNLARSFDPTMACLSALACLGPRTVRLHRTNFTLLVYSRV